MLKSVTLLLCLILLAVCLPLYTASAGDPGWSYSFFLPKGAPNTSTLKLTVEEVPRSEDVFIFHLKQTAPPSVRVTPNGEVQLPFKIGMKVFQNYLDDTKPTRITFDEAETQACKSDISYMENSIFYFVLDALHPMEPIRYTYGTPYTGDFIPFYYVGGVSMTYDANGYTLVRDLAVVLPESEDYTVDGELSDKGLTYVHVQPGKTLPADGNLRFMFDETKVRKAEKNGWFTYGKSKSHLPVTDPEALAAYPTMQNACHITYQVVDKKQKVIHIGVLHGQWTD